MLRLLRNDAERSYESYRWMLNDPELGEVDDDRVGVSRELARIGLSLSMYTQWYWKVDLHNLLGFLRLRADPHAQYEIRAYADVMLKMMDMWVPLASEAFRDYRLGAVSLSREEVDLVRRMVAGDRPERKDTSLSAREWNEFQARFGG